MKGEHRFIQVPDKIACLLPMSDVNYPFSTQFPFRVDRS